LSAEQVTRNDAPARSCSPITSATRRSHGQRSSSSRGVPAAIFATLASGCSSSPSMCSQPSRRASSTATLVFPEPDTPMTTIEVVAGMLGVDSMCRP
jgi:hypothetical protein